MPPLAPGVITPPHLPARLPPALSVPAAVLAVMLGSGLPVVGGFLLVERYEWNGWAAIGVGLAGAVVLTAALLTPVAWARAPRGGWPVRFRLPLPLRVLAWTAAHLVPWVGGFAGAAWLQEEAGWPAPAVGLAAVVALGVGWGGAVLAAYRWCEPVGGTEVLDRLRAPRGRYPHDLPEAVVTAVTGHPVTDVLQLDDGNSLGTVRYELGPDRYIEVEDVPAGSVTDLLARAGYGGPPDPAAGPAPPPRPEPVPGLGREAYLLPARGRTSARLAVWLDQDLGALVLTASPHYDRATRVALARAAVQVREQVARQEYGGPDPR